MPKFSAMLNLVEGSLEFEGRYFRFVPDKEPQISSDEIDINRCELKIEGRNNPVLAIYSRDLKDSHLVVLEDGLLSYLHQIGNRQAEPLLLKTKDTKQSYRLARFKPLLILLLLILVAPLFAFLAPGFFIDHLVSQEAEFKLRKYFEPDEIEKTKEGPVDQMIQTAADLMGARSGITSVAIKVRVSNDPEVNAFALPGGLILMNKGLLMDAQSLDEILGVLAHEMGHVAHRDSMRHLISQSGVLVGLMLASLVIGSDVAGVLQSGGNLAQLKFSRDQELAADTYAADLLARSGLSIRDFSNFMERLSQKDPLAKNGIDLSVLSTHPAGKSRVENLLRLSDLTSTRTNSSLPSQKIKLNFDLKELKAKLASDPVTN